MAQPSMAAAAAAEGDAARGWVGGWCLAKQSGPRAGARVVGSGRREEGAACRLGGREGSRVR